MDISIYLESVNADTVSPGVTGTLGKYIKILKKPGDYTTGLNGIHMALIGVPEERGSINNKGCSKAPDLIRSALYKLYPGDYRCRIADLGNIKPGHSLKDTHKALEDICGHLLSKKITPLIIGGSQDLTYSQYLAYKPLKQTVNIVAVDSCFDLGMADEKIHSGNYLGKIIMQQPNYLFNCSNVGYQTYFAGRHSIKLMDKLYFDAYRLARVRENIEEAEPIVRNADIVSVDISSVKQSDAPGNANASPNGFYAEEICQIIRYAGLSDKVTSIGFYETNPDHDRSGQTTSLVAQMIWCFIDGFYHRKKDYPVSTKTGFVKYTVNLKDTDHEIIFYKSKKTGRWWMEVPYPDNKVKFERHHIIPCSYADYQTACNEEMPDRWWLAFQKLS